MKTQEERSQETVATVLDVAEKHFADLGYSGVSTEAIVEEAGLTRGALYHHFGSKQGLFEALVERLQARLAEAVSQQTEAVEDAWQGFLAGCFVWLERAADPDVQRILLVDGPAVLGWQRWRALDDKYSARLLKEGIRELTRAGLIKTASEGALFHILNGAMNQTALWLSQSPEPEQKLQEAKATLEHILEGLRA